MSKKVCLISDHHICTNPRLWKEAKSLVAEGYEVSILTLFTSKQQLERDQPILDAIGNPSYKAVLNLIPGEASSVTRFYYRFRRKIALLFKKYFKADSPYLLGYAPDKLIQAAKEEKADLYITHIDCAQYVGMRLVQAGKKVGFDIEDWYSKDYLGPTRPVKLLETIEQFALTNGAYCSVPSKSMAKAIVSYYHVNSSPIVIYNGFPQSESIGTSVSKVNSKPSILWFSQTIGPDRGIETIVEALKEVAIPVVLKLIGDHDDDIVKRYTNLFPYELGHELIISGQIPASKLQEEIAKHDIGLAIENNFPDNKDTTVSNKILQYVQAGIKIIATSTKGQMEVAERFPGLIEVVAPGDAKATAMAVVHLLGKGDSVHANAQSVFREVFSWEAQERKLLSKIKEILE